MSLSFIISRFTNLFGKLGNVIYSSCEYIDFLFIFSYVPCPGHWLEHKKRMIQFGADVRSYAYIQNNQFKRFLRMTDRKKKTT